MLFTSVNACILAGAIKLTIAVSSLTTEIFSKMISCLHGFACNLKNLTTLETFVPLLFMITS